MFEKFFEKAKGFMKSFANEFGEKVSVKCPSCGGQAEGTTAEQNLTCPYCDSTIKNPHYIFAKSSAVEREEEQEDDGWGEDKDYWNEMEEDTLPPIPTDSNAVYAWIEKVGMFYTGDIPGFPFAKATLCDSYEQCLETLQENFDEEKEKPYYEKPIQDLEKVRKNHPKAKFIQLY